MSSHRTIVDERKARAALFLAALILLIDRVLVPLTSSTAEFGVLDEPAHLSTCILLLLTLVLLAVRLPPAFTACAMTASMAIDLDHVPQYLGWGGLTAGTPRPFTHGLLTVALFSGAAALSKGWKRDALEGIAFGVAAHLFRDVATGPGIAPCWPVSKVNVHLPYAIYAALIASMALALILTDRRVIAISRS